jgi:hypothetical protein
VLQNSNDIWLEYDLVVFAVLVIGLTAGNIARFLTCGSNSGIRARAMNLRCCDNSRWLG